MRTSIKIAAVIAIIVGASNLAAADGPVRQGLRNAGQATANVAQGVAQGAANVAQGVGNATVNAVGAAGNAIGLTPATPMQARGGAVLDNSRDARWRFARHNGEWWYYNDNNQWQYHRDGQWQQFSQDSFQPANQQLAHGQQMPQGQQHSVGFRGVDQGQQVRHDQHGRAFICQNGQPIYLDQQQQHQELQQQPAQQQPTPAPMPQDQPAAAAAPVPENQAPAAVVTSDSGVVTASGSGTVSGHSDDVSRAPAGGDTSSQVYGDPASPREINNNPTSETNGATENPGQ